MAVEEDCPFRTPLETHPLAASLDVDFIHVPLTGDVTTLTQVDPAKRRITNGPTMDGGLIDRNTR